MLEVPIEGVQDEAVGDFCPDAAAGTIALDFKKHPRLLAGPCESHSAGMFGNSSAPTPGAVMLAVWQWLVP